MEIQKLVEAELERANGTYPLFASNHEAFAVIMEEVYEAKLECIGVEKSMNQYFEDVIKNKSPEHTLSVLKNYAENAIKELIQVSAMCMKAEMSMERRGADEGKSEDY